MFKKYAFLDGALFASCSFINKGLNFLIILLIANYLSPEQYGYLNLYGTVGMILSYFIALSTTGYLSVAFFQNGENGVSRTISSALFISILALFILGGILIGFGHNLSIRLNLPFSILIVAVFVSFFQVFYDLFLNYFRLRQKILNYGLISCGNALLNLFLTFFLVTFYFKNWIGRPIAELICSGVFAVLGTFYFASKHFFTKNIKSFLKPLLCWSLPLIPHLSVSFFRQGCDRYVIEAFYSISDVGIFSLALNFANIISMVGTGFNQSNSVELFKVLSDKSLTSSEKKMKINSKCKLYVKLYTVISIVLLVIGSIFLPVLMPKYEKAMAYFPILALYGYLVCIYLVYTNFLFYYKKTKELMYITFTSAVFHLLLSLVLTRYSLYYTAGIYVLTQFLIVLFVKRNVKRLLLNI